MKELKFTKWNHGYEIIAKNFEDGTIEKTVIAFGRIEEVIIEDTKTKERENRYLETGDLILDDQNQKAIFVGITEDSSNIVLCMKSHDDEFNEDLIQFIEISSKGFNQECILKSRSTEVFSENDYVHDIWRKFGELLVNA